MVDTPRALPALLAEAPDNTSHVITPQVLRDVIVSAAIRSPADWLYRFGASPTVGRVNWNGVAQVRLNEVDEDGVNRAALLGLLLQPGNLVRLVDTTSLAYLACAILDAANAGPIWTLNVAVLGQVGAFSVLDLVAVSVGVPNAIESPGASYTAQVKGAGAVLTGQAVAVHGSGVGVILADGTSIGTAAAGLAQIGAGLGSTAEVQTNGALFLSDWTGSTGSPSLPARADFFLDPAAPGMLTTTPPTAAGQVLQYLGTAVHPQILRLEPSQPLLL